MDRQLNCPKCGKWGQVVFAGSVNLTMECSSCKTRWKIENIGVCLICDNMNNYPKDGVCLKCYEKTYNKKRGIVDEIKSQKK